MNWQRYFCSATNRDGSSCGNPSPDGRRGFCAVHRARDIRDAAARRRGERVRWYCHTCHKTHDHTPAERDAHRDEIRAAEVTARTPRDAPDGAS